MKPELEGLLALAVVASVTCGCRAHSPVDFQVTEENSLRSDHHNDLSDVADPPASELKRVIEDTDGVVFSAAFKTRVSGYHDLATRVGGDTIDGDDFLKTYLEPSDTTAPAKVAYVTARKDCGHQTASTGLGIEINASTGVNHENLEAFTVLNRCTIGRITSTSMAARACAINTLAHEWTHAVVDRADHVQVYQDNGHRDAKNGLVSYVVGAVAQCVYLDRFFYVSGGGPRSPANGFDWCVRTVGTTSFDPGTCSDDWATRSFGARAQ